MDHKDQVVSEDLEAKTVCLELLDHLVKEEM